MTVEPGARFGPYEIVSPLGAGGMGEVYRAIDPRIGRPVAIKILPDSLTADADRLQRFEQEARSAGLLNHNNLLTIYELGSHEGAPYIVSELLEGESLRERMEAGAIAPRKAIEYAAQIARGLAAAHDKSIVHRDIKPENLFVTRDGRVKILDFGLAKLTANDAAGSDVRTAQRMTAPGTVLGTVGYMAPEQVRGGAVDHRSDIFSLGVVLHEMLTGRHPFQRDTSAETMTAILREDPPEITLSGSQVTPALDRVVRHCMEKNPEERFQSARDLLFDLESLSGTSASHPSTAATGPRRLPRYAVIAAAILAVVAIAAVAFFAGRRTGGATDSVAPETAEFQQVTYLPGSETSPSLSPDGRTVAFSSRSEGKEDIYIQRVDGRNAMNLTRDVPGDHAQPAFSPDGERIAFSSSREGGGIFLMGATGEAMRRLTAMGASPSWSPDGLTIVFATERFFSPYARQALSSIYSVDVATGRTTLLLNHDGVQPRFSPHGTRIAFWALPQGSGDREIFTMPATGDPDGTKTVRVTKDPYTDWNPFWSPDGKWLYFASDRHGSMNLWRVAIDEESGQTHGDPERVMLPASSIGEVSPSPDGSKVVFTNLTQSSRIEEWSIEDPQRPPHVVFEGPLLATNIGSSPDGRHLAFSAAAPQEDLYVIGTDGSGLRQLTNDAEKDRGPDWSPDGSEIAFYSSREGRWDVWSIRVDGSGLRRLTRTPGDQAVVWPRWSSDGKRLTANHGRNSEIFDLTHTPTAGREVAVRGLEPGTGFSVGDWSPDQRYLAGEIWRDSLAIPGVVLVDLQTGEARTAHRLRRLAPLPARWPDSDHDLGRFDAARRPDHPQDPATLRRRSDDVLGGGRQPPDAVREQRLLHPQPRWTARLPHPHSCRVRCLAGLAEQREVTGRSPTAGVQRPMRDGQLMISRISRLNVAGF